MPNKPLIMIIEDEVDVSNSIAALIKESNKYDVITAYSAQEGLKQLSKHKTFGRGNNIGLILLDIKMPGMDGLDFLVKLRQEYPPEKIGVLMVTAWEDQEKFEKAREGLVVGYVKKPFKSNDLLETIARFFAGKGKWMIEQTKWETLGKEESIDKEKKIQREKNSY